MHFLDSNDGWNIAECLIEAVHQNSIKNHFNSFKLSSFSFM